MKKLQSCLHKCFPGEIKNLGTNHPPYIPTYFFVYLSFAVKLLETALCRYENEKWMGLLA